MEEKFNWVVLFEKGGKLYPYTNRSITHMGGVLEESHKKSGRYPYRMWVLIDDELEPVEITP